MTDKYQNKYRIASARLQDWDYGWCALYFVTICTQKSECFFGGGDGDGDGRNGNCRDAMHCVSTVMMSHPSVISQPKNQFGPQSKNLASIIRGFKIGVTKNARMINPDFAWQPRFYDHIIRNDKSYQNISEYIINNPVKWIDDRFNPNKNEGDLCQT